MPLFKFVQVFTSVIFGLFHLHFRYVVQIIVHSDFDLVGSLLALEATEPVSEPLTQGIIAFELINIHLISVQQKRSVYKLHSFSC